MESKRISEGGTIELNDEQLEVAKKYKRDFTGKDAPFDLEEDTLCMNDFYVGTLNLPNITIEIEPQMRFVTFEDLIQIWLLAKSDFTRELSETKYSTSKDTFQTALVERFLEELEALLNEGKHIDYKEKEKASTIVKGRVRPEIVTGPNKIFCEFDELTQDNLPNRIIKKGLELVNNLEKNNTDISRINRYLSYFKYPDDMKNINSDIIDRAIDRINYRNKKYYNVLKLVKLLIDSRISSEGWRKLEYNSFLENYNRIFEECVRNVLNIYSEYSVPKEKKQEKYGKIEYGDKEISKEYEPDILVKNPEGQNIAVGDVKNKYKGSFRNTFFDNLEVFQILFYVCNERVSKGILIYPTPKDEKIARLSLQNFMGKKIEVFALSFPIHGSLDTNARNFSNKFDSIISSLE